MSVTVTVHRDVVSARRDMAGALESAMRCPERLNATDRVRGLPRSTRTATRVRDLRGRPDREREWLAEGGKARPFDWYKFRVGPVTVAATARHGAGRSEDEDSAITSDLAKGVSFVASDVDRQGRTGETGETGGTGGTGATGGPTATEGAEQ